MSCPLRVPAWRSFGLSRHGDKADGQEALARCSLGRAANANEILFVAAHRKDQPAAFAKLIHQHLRDVIRGCGHNDGIEGGRFRPAPVAISSANMNVLISEALKTFFGLSRERLDNFNRVDFS